MTELEATIRSANPVPESGPGSEVAVPAFDDVWAAAQACARGRPRSVAAGLGRHPRAVWSALGVASAGVVGGIVTAVVLLSSGAGVAYAGWTATPRQATASAVARSSRMCNRLGIANARYDREFRGIRRSDVFTGTPVLTEARGIYTAVVSHASGRLFLCLAGARPAKPPRGTVVWFTSVPARPGPDEISFPYGSTGSVSNAGGPHQGQKLAKLGKRQRLAALLRMLGGGYGQYVLGRVGADVTGVSFAFANGDVVTATVANGRYFAWWPWVSEATSVTLTTSSGTLSSRLYKQRGVFLATMFVPRCTPGARGCAFAPDVRTPV